MGNSVRKGFTLVELLVVMGIILVLIGIAYMGMRHVTNTAARYQTEVQLKICADMLKEYQGINGLSNIEGPASTAIPAPQITLPNPPWLNDTFLLPIFVDSPNASEIAGKYIQPHSALTLDDFSGSPILSHKGVPQTPGGQGDMGDTADSNNPRWVCDAVRWTQGIMYILLKDPSNRALISGLPPRRILETPPPITQTNPNAPGDAQRPNFTIDAAVPLDGWGSPIIFVPRGGIHVFMDPSNTGSLAEYVVRTSGTYLVGSGLPPISPADHPFFASAGQDRFFTALQEVFADPEQRGYTQPTDHSSDNVYSFQEQ